MEDGSGMSTKRSWYDLVRPGAANEKRISNWEFGDGRLNVVRRWFTFLDLDTLAFPDQGSLL
jgi:hypothetical protein